MPTDRPTFSELWYRVCDLHPRLRPSVQTYRQAFRGQMYHVLRDPSDNQFFRVDDAAYHFVALLDGKRTVAEVWRACNDHLGDRAPTQGETIQLLGQLYASNLLLGDMPPDSQGMFERYRKRVRREIGGFMMNLLFVRIPLVDPDHLLDRWLPIARWAFTWPGLAVWALLVLAGLVSLVGRTDELSSGASNILDPNNLLLLYLSFAVVKALHELGHGFSCKKYGVDTGTGGEVHTIGLMFLVFMPVPYVDASSASAFRSKWQKAVVGAAGMYVELAVAAIAAIIWSQTSQGGSAFVHAVHAISYNVMFIASVSTLLFNGNPLLRYDGYYILADLLEIPNLSQRSRDYLYYLVRRYVFGVRRPMNPARSRGERAWLAVYAVTSTIYRVFISIAIFLFVAKQFFIFGMLLAFGAVIGWVFVPLSKFSRYLLTHGELSRVRSRAAWATLGGLAFLVLSLGVIPVPDRARAQGVVEPRSLAVIHMEANGFITGYLPSNSLVEADDGPLVSAADEELVAQHKSLQAEYHQTEVERRKQSTKDMAAVQVLDERLEFLRKQIAFVQDKIESLRIKAPVAGEWISPEIDALRGSFAKEGDMVGLVASTDDLLIRVVADQNLGPRIAQEAGLGSQVDVRLRARPDISFTGRVEKLLPAGQKQLPSAALGYLAGGATEVDMKDPKGLTAAEPFFEVVIRPDPLAEGLHLLSGQRVVVRFHMPPKPLAVQVWHAFRQLFQKRFRV
ncbi:MAG: hypothetical protein IT443_13240 [Phycisphaeraceae bacterium]|nr:hypothetical protein [Phycisphaeraceae bacterium]